MLEAGAWYASSLQWPEEHAAGGELGATFAELAIDFELATGLDLPAAERRLVATEASAGAVSQSPAAASAPPPEPSATPAEDTKHKLKWDKATCRWVCSKCKRSCGDGNYGSEKTRFMKQTCAGRVETRAEAIARTKKAQGAKARAAAREAAGADAAKLYNVSMAEKRSANRTIAKEVKLVGRNNGPTSSSESVRRPIGDRARAMGDLVRAVGRQAGVQAFPGERLDVCRALVPLGLPPLAGLARRPLLLAGRHTEHALKSLASSLGGPWRKVREGSLEPRGGSERSSAKRAADWGEEVEPDYTGRPPAAWSKGARPISVVKRPSGPEETSRRPGGTPGAGPVGKQKHCR